MNTALAQAATIVEACWPTEAPDLRSARLKLIDEAIAYGEANPTPTESPTITFRLAASDFTEALARIRKATYSVRPYTVNGVEYVDCARCGNPLQIHLGRVESCYVCRP